MPSRLRRAPADNSQRRRYSYRAGPLGGNNLSRSRPASFQDFPSPESKTLAPLPSTSSRPPTKTYGLRTAQTTVPAFPSAADSSPPFARMFSIEAAPFFHISPEKSGRYSHSPLQIRFGYFGL